MIKQPPLQAGLVNDDKMVTPTWKQWFTELFASNLVKQTLTAAGVVGLDANHVDISKSGAGTYAITLAAPTQPGILKTIQMTAVSGGGTVTLALANCIGGTASTTATFDAVDETLILVSALNKWVIIKQHGVTLT